MQIRAIEPKDKNWILSFLKEEWGSPVIAAHGHLIDASILKGFIAHVDEERLGLVTFRLESLDCEIVSLNSKVIGGGKPLVNAVLEAARREKCRRLWLITTNDNLGALRFYQKIGFHLKAVHPNALEVSRKLKPSIPLMGIGGIPLRDEIELEMVL